MIYNFYSTPHPELDENVLVIFTEKYDSFFKGKLLEYDYTCIMTLQDTTKKKKIYCWNKLIKLNKKIIAKIINIDIDKKIVQLSVLYLNDNIDMNYFNENKQMEQFIKSFCIINNYEFVDIWTNLIYPIDIKRRQYINSQNDNLNKIFLSLWEYFTKNILLFNDLFIDKDNANTLYLELLDYYNKKNIIYNYKYISKLNIISNIGIIKLKEYINNILNKQGYPYELKYITTPYYSFETSSIDLTENNHKLIISNLINELSQYDIKISEHEYSKKIKY